MARVGQVPQQAKHHVGGGHDEVLAIVDEQEQLLVAKVVDDWVDRGLAGLELDLQGPCDLTGDERGVAQRGQLDDPDAIVMVIDELACGLEHQPGLAGATHADQGDEAIRAQQTLDVHDFPLPPDEGCDRERQVRGDSDDRAKRRELAAQAWCRELVHMLGSIQVAQAMLALVDQLGHRREIVNGQGPRRIRDEHLAPVAERHQAGDPVEGRPEEVPVPDLGAAGVDCHAHAERPGFAPFVEVQRSLTLEGCLQRRLRSVERRQQPVTRGLDDRPAGLFHGRTQQRVVRFESDGHRRPTLCPEPRAALDVGEEERRRTGRGCCRHPSERTSGAGPGGAA